jgi:hypothetical protein
LIATPDNSGMNEVAHPHVDQKYIDRYGSFENVIAVTLARLSLDLKKAEKSILSQEQSSCPVIHAFGPGLYIREVFMPAGTIAIGHEQRFEQMNVLLKGRVVMLNKNGNTVELVAPMAFTGPPGQKIGYIAEDMVWQNIYATTETDIEKLEAMFLVKDDVWEEDRKQRIDSLRPEKQPDRDDYMALLEEFGISHAQARAETEHQADMRVFPYGRYKVMVKESPIDGRGMFATAPIEAGEVIAPARIEGKRTPAGRYVNHSISPNAHFVLRENGDLDLVASVGINGNMGGRTESEITIDYRQALAQWGLV